MKNKFDTADLFTNRENHRGKTPLGDFKSPFPRIHYYQSQVVTSIKNLTKPFGLSKNPLMHESQYVTNQCAQILVRD